MINKFLLFLIIINCGYFSAQHEADSTKNIIYGGFGRQGIGYLKYGRSLFFNNWSQTTVNIGFGGVPGDGEYDEPRMNKIMPEITQLLGYKFLFLEIGIEPSINFYGNVTFIDLNGIIGLRYKSKVKNGIGLFGNIGYNPKLYKTFESEIELPFYLGMGVSF